MNLTEINYADEATDIHFRSVPKKAFFSSSKKKNEKTGETLLRLQPPKCDPDLPNKPPVEWMTKAQLQDEALAPSWNWVETGHGQAGKLFLEIIGCDDLPNMVRLMHTVYTQKFKKEYKGYKESSHSHLLTSILCAFPMRCKIC